MERSGMEAAALSGWPNAHPKGAERSGALQPANADSGLVKAKAAEVDVS